MSFTKTHPASFKDPAGFIFEREGILYRQVNRYYQDDYNLLISSGLYDLLTGKNLLIRHQEIKENLSGSANWYTTIQPEIIPFISYPYEWCFDQLKDAALLTLDILKISLEKGMILKDATGFNTQFRNGSPVFIDTLSFERYDPSKPWVAYRQFCECFLFPLLLAKYTRINFQQLLRVWFEGIPSQVTSQLLPLRARFSAAAWMHVFLQNKVANVKKGTVHSRHIQFSKQKLLTLASHLQQVTAKLALDNKTTWRNYYEETILSKEYLQEKEKIVLSLFEKLTGKKILDAGANDGYFSLLAAKKGFMVLAADYDEQCINDLYIKIKQEGNSSILPLCIDISNPSPALGFENKERSSFTERIRTDTTLALALVHHLVIGKNIPLARLAGYFSSVSPQLIIEFVPKEDEKTALLLANKKDIYEEYTEAYFEEIFGRVFHIGEKHIVPGTNRVIYLMTRRS